MWDQAPIRKWPEVSITFTLCLPLLSDLKYAKFVFGSFTFRDNGETPLALTRLIQFLKRLCRLFKTFNLLQVSLLFFN